MWTESGLDGIQRPVRLWGSWVVAAFPVTSAETLPWAGAGLTLHVGQSSAERVVSPLAGGDGLCGESEREGRMSRNC